MIPRCLAENLDFDATAFTASHNAFTSSGAIVAWSGDRSGTYHIYSQRVSSAGIIQWTPNGVQLGRGGHSDLWIVPAPGWRAASHHGIMDDTAANGDPSWSPDGEFIAFTSDGSGNSASDLRTIRVESKTWSDLKQLYR